MIKKKTRTWLIVLILFLVLIASGLLYLRYKSKAVYLVVPAVTELKKAKIRIAGDSIFVNIEASLQNKSFLKLNIRGISFLISSREEILLKNKINLHINLEPKDAAVLTLPLTLNLKQLLQKIQGQDDQDSLLLTADITIYYDTRLGKTQLSSKRDITIPFPRPPKFDLIRLSYQGYKHQKVLADAEIKIINPGHLRLKVNEIKYTLKIADMFEVHEKQKAELSLLPKTNTVVTLHLEANVTRPLLTAFHLLAKDKQLPYNLFLTCNASNDSLLPEGIPLEIQKSGLLDLKK